MRRFSDSITVLLLLLGAATVQADDCQGRLGSFHYVSERCYNATHVLEQSGSCNNGESHVTHASFRSCQHSSGKEEDVGYCHQCGANRLVCSDSMYESEACDTSHKLDGICDDAQDTYAVYWGCATPEYAFRTAQVCQADRDLLNPNDEKQALQHSQQACAVDFPGFERCLVCQGTQLCIPQDGLDGKATCSAFGMHDGLNPTEDIVQTTTPKPPPEGNGEMIDNALYMPLDPHDPAYDCASFRGNVNFYKEECYNTTHSMVVSGTCIDGTLLYGSRAIAPCSIVPPGNNDPDALKNDPRQSLATYCHACGDNKLTCSSSPDAEAVCDKALAQPTFLCPSTTVPDLERPWIVSSYTGCNNGTNYYYNYEFCVTDPGSPGVVFPYADKQNAPCGSTYDGLDYCSSCRDGLQLCSDNPHHACGTVHDYREELQHLNAPLDCSLVIPNVDFYKERCYNATHTLRWTGRCVDGVLVHASAEIEPCATPDAPEQVYCHECPQHHSHLVCSSATIPHDACAAHATVEEAGMVISDLCAVSHDRTSSFGGCADDETYSYAVAKCKNGQLSIDRTTEKCSDSFPDFPYCASCDSFQICASDKTMCAELELHSSDHKHYHPRPGEDDTTDVLGENDDSVLGDTVDCGPVTTNLHYYMEECFNATHVKLSQGECVHGEKHGRKTVLQSCVDYGEDASRQYCHSCPGAAGGSGPGTIVCSNSDLRESVCDKTASARQIEGQAANASHICHDNDAATSISHLGGSFACLDEHVFSTLFQTCHEGTFAAEQNAFDCNQNFPGFGYCRTCGNINVCSAEQQTSCEGLGIVDS